MASPGTPNPSHRLASTTRPSSSRSICPKDSRKAQPRRIVLLFIAISHSPEKFLEHPPGSELAIATIISGAERYPVCKQVGQHVSVPGVFVCALADTESLPQL
jgi:hypothetical protein